MWSGVPLDGAAGALDGGVECQAAFWRRVVNWCVAENKDLVQFWGGVRVTAISDYWLHHFSASVGIEQLGSHLTNSHEI